ncbi:NAD-dependent epimerase/dehydratase family protein [Hoeflea sp. YIM 152468]|uniref:NAD-dependent epimerase/dehydratase family protein n=1 Tax=Hoeflea sp. YIM 152468 TaxID=3031759 RepID=UPI0023DA2A66|nr:NAD-dependent epimerase/dehydratase family protein [Hoeflea sp. YIM 152468]MDF1610279.1 NAD-dependent epimerase/dehydratase family protein [Hoeflea sp. YIM 152468]
MKVYITGGYGQVGSTVAAMFLARGDSVFSIDNFATGRRDNLVDHPNLTALEGSIIDADVVDKTMEEFGPDVVIHTAASYKDPEDWYSDALVNGVGTANVAKSAKKHGVKRFVYFQTALCYGLHPKEQPITLDHPIEPDNCSYAISKTCGENYVHLSGLDWVTFRLANVIGERNVSGPLPIFYSRLSEGKKCFVTEARRDFCYAGDLAKVVVKASDGMGSGTYHFSSGKDVAIRELYDAVVNAMKLNDYPEPEVRPLGPDDAASILLDPSRLRADFGDVEITSLADIAQVSVDRWSREGVVGGYTHLKEARGEIRKEGQ